MLMVSNKTVLFICPDFFDYKKLIAEELEKHFDRVISFSDRPLCSSVSKALFKYNVPLYSTRMSERYGRTIFDAIVNDLPTLTDVVIVKGTCITPSFIDLLRQHNHNLKITSYSWDSISNIKTFPALASKSDRAFTFDLRDSFDFKLEYLPLFYSESRPAPVAATSAIPEYDYTFIGSYHGDRISVLSRFLERKKQATTCIKIYFQSRLQYLFYYLRDPALRACPKEWLTFEPVSRNNLEALTAASAHVIDIHHQKQTGLTMRTWETLQGNRHLITTNPAVLLHTTGENVTVLDRITGQEWSLSQCEAYKESINREDPHLKPMGCLSLSAWVNALLTKS
ncbi:hypothetical protein EDF81_1184 [Enterobacter sp. BIGb0383]|uniref:hypothetical protein n=2 Tax=unclassified Enterobacter TaxID=2608935 RepID=UPI000F461DCA|nr:hypothetical protein [Enterobacter sp. BIGb0383]ROP62679.1 hypothetical protein EDF81_1184 [Enterobacter sp. BIGb0383]ROS12840.1 hypothetical protein EC848_1186 [Enterobacter sp. BIGb0359]